MKKFIKNNKTMLVTICMSALIAGSGYEILKYETKRNNEIAQYKATIQELEYQVKNLQIENEALDYTIASYQEEDAINKQLIDELREKNSSLASKVEELENLVNVSLQYDANNYSRSSLSTKPLDKYAVITVEELNEWIAERAPSDSPFIGQAEAFLEAAKQSGLDPKYIVAHAGLESAWGTSAIARDKFNFFGIAAYNHDPYNSAKTFSSFEEGIVEGAKWIKRNYTDEGQNTLSSMIYGEKAYCVDDSGEPSQSWIDKIVSIILHKD